MIVFAVISGLSNLQILHSLGAIIADIFIRIFKCISLPIIALSIIVTISSYSSKDLGKKIWQKTLFYTITTTIVAASVACILYLIISPENITTHHGVYANPSITKGINYLQYLTTLIPSNIFSPFLNHQVMGVLLVGIIMGIAIRNIPESGPRKITADFFIGIHGLFLVITKWVVSIIPIAIYGFITTTVVQLREGIEIKDLGKYLLIVVLANCVQGFIILPLWLKLNKIPPFTTMSKMMPALLVAFFSKSSAGTLPVTIETAEKQLQIPPKISRFVLPLCTSINMNGCAAFIFITVIYLMQNHGIEITLGTMLIWIVIATIAAVGNAGVPMGCFFLSASLLASMDVPIVLLGIILPFYSIIDMIETSLNVWSDICVTKVVADKISEPEA